MSAAMITHVSRLLAEVNALPEHVEPLTLRLHLDVDSSAGADLQVRPAAFTHNSLTDEEYLAGFRAQCLEVEAQLQLFLRARRRRLNAQLVPPGRGATAPAADGPMDTLWGTVEPCPPM